MSQDEFVLVGGSATNLYEANRFQELFFGILRTKSLDRPEPRLVQSTETRADYL